MEQEMTENKAEITEILELQFALVDSIDVYMNNEEITLSEILMRAEGIQIPIVKNTSWRSFLNTKMEIMDYEVIAQMTEIEEGKQFLRIKSEKLLDFVYEHAQ